eukprot:12766-Heterococcus_DN1.PRE.3
MQQSLQKVAVILLMKACVLYVQRLTALFLSRAGAGAGAGRAAVCFNRLTCMYFRSIYIHRTAAVVHQSKTVII